MTGIRSVALQQVVSAGAKSSARIASFNAVLRLTHKLKEKPCFSQEYKVDQEIVNRPPEILLNDGKKQTGDEYDKKDEVKSISSETEN